MALPRRDRQTNSTTLRPLPHWTFPGPRHWSPSSPTQRGAIWSYSHLLTRQTFPLLHLPAQKAQKVQRTIPGLLSTTTTPYITFAWGEAISIRSLIGNDREHPTFCLASVSSLTHLLDKKLYLPPSLFLTRTGSSPPSSLPTSPTSLLGIFSTQQSHKDTYPKGRPLPLSSPYPQNTHYATSLVSPSHNSRRLTRRPSHPEHLGRRLAYLEQIHWVHHHRLLDNRR